MEWREDPFSLFVERVNGGWTMKGWVFDRLLFNRHYEKGEIYSDQEAVDVALEHLVLELRRLMLRAVDTKIVIQEGSL